MRNQENYQRAKKRAEEKFRFKVHLGAYLFVNAVLILINLSSSPDNLWFQWPLMGWGIAIFWHAMTVYVFKNGSPITEEMIQKEMEK